MPLQRRPANLHLEPRELELLLIIAESPEPLGARELRRRLAEPAGTSESTLNRMLRGLDEKGLTRSQAGRGRVAIRVGKSVAEQARTERRWQNGLGELEIRTLEDARDLVVARRALEREIVRSAAETSTPHSLRALKIWQSEHSHSIDSEQERCKAAIEFHRELVRICPNQMLRAPAMVLFDRRFDSLEQILDIVTAGRGRISETPNEHDSIVEAVMSRDPDAAEAAMLNHLDHLADNLSASVSPNTKLAIEIFLHSRPRL